MDDFAESLWAAFAAESEEHLASVEPAIASAEADPPSEDAIAQMFRDFHSLKGLSRGMGMTAMEEVAHHAESVLGLVRAGTMRLSGDSVRVLLEAVDALRGLRALAVSARQDGDVPVELVARLKVLAEAGAPISAGPAKPVSAPDSFMGIDEDMCRYFAELLRDDVGELGQRLVSLSTKDEEGVPGNLERVAELLDELRHASATMELPALATLFQALAGAVRPGLDWTVFHLLTRLEEFVTAFEQETGMESGAATFRADLHDLLMGFAMSGRDRLAAALRQLHDEPAALAEAVAHRYEAVAEAAGDLGHVLAIYPERLAGSQAAFLLQDVFARAALGEVHPTASTVAAALDLAESIGGGTEDATAEVRTRFLGLALADMGGAGEPQAGDFVRAVLRKQKVAEDLISGLSPESVAEAAHLMAEGWDRAVVVEARLEEDGDMAARFRAWLVDKVRPLTNRIHHQDGESWYRFVVLCRDDLDQVRQALATIDSQPGRRLVRLVDRQQPAPSSAPVSGPATREGTAIRVSSEVIDRFMAHIGELLLARSTIHLALAESGMETVTAHLRKAADRLPPDQAEELRRDLARLETGWEQLSRGDQNLQGVLKRLQESALELRVVPIDTVFSRFPRVVRDVAEKTGKQVRLELSGRDVRIDKGMVEQLVDPLTHMVRNAIDHGVESPAERTAAGKPAAGSVRLSASQRGNRVMIEIADDGRGLDRARIAAKAAQLGLIQPQDADAMADDQVFGLIFAPGFSTNETVTEMSGRGVGMDVVNVNIGRLGGRVSIRSTPGMGTTFTLSLPLSAAIQDVLLVEAGRQTFALPERFLLEICEVESSAFQSVHGQTAILLRNSYLPVVALADLLGLPRRGGAAGARTVLIVGAGSARLGIEVEKVARRQELYVKDVHSRLLAIPGVGGASVLGDGRVVIILDVEGLFKLAASRRAPPPAIAAE